MKLNTFVVIFFMNTFLLTSNNVVIFSSKEIHTVHHWWYQSVSLNKKCVPWFPRKGGGGIRSALTALYHKGIIRGGRPCQQGESQQHDPHLPDIVDQPVILRRPDQTHLTLITTNITLSSSRPPRKQIVKSSYLSFLHPKEKLRNSPERELRSKYQFHAVMLSY